nr:BOI-related E3 ubiquitin-protein ligase 1-like [Ipomoea batatas]
MAVEATHLNLFSAQQLIPNRGFVSSAKGNGFGFGYNAQMGSGIPYGSVAMPESFLPVNRSLFCENVQGKTSINTDSGLSYNLAMEGSRKRSREEQFIASGEDVTPLLQQYQSEIDRIVSNHTKKLRMELEERQKQEARILVAAIGEDVMKKVREKDEQIQTLGKLNFALQERVKSLYLENQLWRDLAQSNEATANSLRSNLEKTQSPAATATKSRRPSRRGRPPAPTQTKNPAAGSAGAAARENPAFFCCRAGISAFARFVGPLCTVPALYVILT